MDGKYREILDELLKLQNLTEWERNAFGDMVERDTKYNFTLSVKQRALIERARDKYILGKKQEKGLDLPEEYDNCKLVFGDQGVQIEIAGRLISKPMTRKEGQIILAWIDGIEHELMGGNTSEAQPSAEDEPLPF